MAGDAQSYNEPASSLNGTNEHIHLPNSRPQLASLPRLHKEADQSKQQHESRDDAMARHQSRSKIRRDIQRADLVRDEELDDDSHANSAERDNEHRSLTRLDRVLEEARAALLDEEEADTQGESSGLTTGSLEENGNADQSPLPAPICDLCREEKEIADLIVVPCLHEFCPKCIVGLFTACLTDESLFPPRCCRQTIPIETAGPFLSDDLKAQYAEKRIELDTPNRTYCTRPNCSAFIMPENIRRAIGTCAKCHTDTCTRCKGRAHANQECPKDPDIESVRTLARQEGWQTCPSCHRVVELHEGCHHIVCRCGAEFCYVCGKQWKTCGCPRWDEERLQREAPPMDEEEAAEYVAGQIEHFRRLRAERRQQQQERRNRRLARLRLRGDCPHEREDRIEGTSQCQECYRTMTLFVFECRHCRLRSCQRCRRIRQIAIEQTAQVGTNRL